MIAIIQKLILIVLFVSLWGCATVYKIGKEFNSENTALINVGESTQQQILTLFGQPLNVGIINGNDVYIYLREDIIFQTNDKVIRKGNTLIIEFDQNKIVSNYYLNIPGKESSLFVYFLHKRNKEKEFHSQQTQNQF